MAFYRTRTRQVVTYQLPDNFCIKAVIAWLEKNQITGIFVQPHSPVSLSLVQANGNTQQIYTGGWLVWFPHCSSIQVWRPELFEQYFELVQEFDHKKVDFTQRWPQW